MPDEDRHHGGEADEIRLVLPAFGSYGRVARLAVTGLASRNGYSYDDVEDLRIAVGELFGMLVRPESGDHQLSFTCRLSTDRLEVEASRVPTAPLADVTDLTRQILAAVTDEFEIDAPAGSVTIVKLLRGPA